jgi:hypothetical protein
MLRMNAVFKIVCLVIILSGLNCRLSAPPSAKTPETVVPAIPTDPTLIPAAPRKPIDIVRDSPTDVIHRDVIQKISEGQYLAALDEINMMFDAHTSSEAYVIEAQVLRLILLTSIRISYLRLANGYQEGWEAVLKIPDIYLPTKERTDRLTNLSRISGNYYERHKEITVQLIKAYNVFSEIPPDSIKARLRIIALKSKYPKIITNTLLEKIKEGNVPITAKREEAEKSEIHNCVLLFWTALTGLKTPDELNLVLAGGAYSLEQKGFYSWLAGCFRWQTEQCRAEAFGDKPDLRKILINRANDFSEVVDRLITNEASPLPPEAKITFTREQYYPETLFPKPTPKK